MTSMRRAAQSYVTGSYCSYRQILGLAVPAVLLNAAAPLTTTVQTILLGHLNRDVKEQVAAFAAVSVVSNFVVFLLNFLVRFTIHGTACSRLCHGPALWLLVTASWLGSSLGTALTTAHHIWEATALLFSESRVQSAPPRRHTSPRVPLDEQVDGVSAKLGNAAGHHRWAKVQRDVRSRTTDPPP
jgi:hypothetical protein